MPDNQSILLIIGFLIVMYLLLGRNEKFAEQDCIKTPGTECNLGNKKNRCGTKCCRCKCNSNSC